MSAAPGRKRARGSQPEQALQPAAASLPARFDSLEALTAATQALRAAEPRLAALIDDLGPPERLLSKTTSCFTSLAKTILYQQLAGSAAAAIYARFLAACKVPDESQLTPRAVLGVAPATLRGCGLSERKASYLADLAAHFEDGRLSDQLLTTADGDALHAALTAVRGLGPWSVDMFQIFYLGSPDVLPVGDLGVRKGLAHLYGLPALPGPREMEELTAGWRPYRSVGSYFMWRLPLPPAKQAAKGKRQPAAGAAGAGAAAVAVRSPLGAAVAAVADVGVNPAAPVIAAAAVARVAAAGGCEGGGQQLHTPPKLMLAGQQQDAGCGTAAGAAADPTADPAASGGGSGMLTRRRLRMGGDAPPPAAAAPQGGGRGSSRQQLRARVVDL